MDSPRRSTDLGSDAAGRSFMSVTVFDIPVRATRGARRR
jgi:hypothetical protein